MMHLCELELLDAWTNNLVITYAVLEDIVRKKLKDINIHDYIIILFAKRDTKNVTNSIKPLHHDTRDIDNVFSHQVLKTIHDYNIVDFHLH